MRTGYSSARLLERCWESVQGTKSGFDLSLVFYTPRANSTDSQQACEWWHRQDGCPKALLDFTGDAVAINHGQFDVTRLKAIADGMNFGMPVIERMI